MAFNLVKLENDLKNVPDQSLIGYVQNPTGQVPTYLALSELERRKRMREGAQAGQGDQPTVAEKLTTPEQPQMPQQAQMPQQPPMMPQQNIADQGIASVAPNNMFRAAEGGIVSFQKGGSGGGITREEFDKLTPQQQKQYLEVANQRRGFLNTLKAGVEPFAYPAQGIANIGTKARNLFQPVRKFIGTDSPLAGPETPPNLMPSYDPEYGLEQYRESLPSALPKTSAPAAAPTAPTAPTQGGLAQLAAADMPQQAPPPAGDRGAGTTSDTGITSLMPNESMFKPIETDTAGFDALMRSKKSLGEYGKEYMDELGVDPNRAKQEERLAAMQGRAEKEEAQAPWMALAEAGLGMAAGNSPFALQNIATGGMQGVKSLQAAKERAAKAEEKRFDLEAKIAESQRAEQVAALNYGAESKQAEERNNTTVGLQKQAAVQSDKQFNSNIKIQEMELKLRMAGIEKQIKSAERVAANQLKSMERGAEKDRLTVMYKGLSDTATVLQKQLSDLYDNKKNAMGDKDLLQGINARIDALEPQLENIITRLSTFTSDASDTSASGFKLVSKRPSKQ